MDKSLQILLSNVFYDRNMNSLLDSGLDFRGIAELTDFAIQNEYIIVGVDDITLSQQGIQKLQDLRKDRKNIPKEQWILGEERSKIRKITKDFIFLPHQNELP